MTAARANRNTQPATLAAPARQSSAALVAARRVRGGRIDGDSSMSVYVLWPRWPGPPVGADAPALPITIARRHLQRASGRHPRAGAAPAGRAGALDLAFLWPSLEPPDANAKPQPASAAAAAPAPTIERVFMTISAAGNTLSPAERVASIYPRYAAAEAAPGPGGLAVLAFREGTPYQGEDLIYDAAGAGLSGALQPRRPAARRPASACTSSGSKPPMWWCAFRAIGWTIGARSPAPSIGWSRVCGRRTA